MPEEAAIREQYWIDKLNTYHYGYNATYGGDGKPLYNYKIIAEKYLELKSQQATAKFFHCDPETVKKACDINGITTISSSVIMAEKFGKQIYCVELNKIFNTQGAAARFLQENNYTSNKSITSIIKNIVRSCKDKQRIQTAYKMHWQYI